MQVEINRFFAHIAPQHLNVLSLHARPVEHGREPVSAGVGVEVVLQPFGAAIMQSKANGGIHKSSIHSRPAHPTIAGDEKCLRIFRVSSLTQAEPSPQKSLRLIVKEYYAIGSLCSGLEHDTAVLPIDIYAAFRVAIADGPFNSAAFPISGLHSGLFYIGKYMVRKRNYSICDKL
jgi:hypothetical protein